MANPLLLSSILHYVENNIHRCTDHRALEKAIGFSYHTIREFFQDKTGMSLGKYITGRKITYAAYDILSTDRNITDIALSYGFDAYDTFTRAFRRETGWNPSEFRSQNTVSIINRPIAIGIYGPELSSKKPLPAATAPEDDSYILYGVPKVEYSSGKCTPMPACLESILNYTGHPHCHSYEYLMAASGASFRFLWNKQGWDPSAVDIANIEPAQPFKPYIQAMNAAGISYRILEKTASSKKQFIDAVKTSLQKGIPVLAQGIIGPPEACIITGYQNHGEILTGWNYFQEHPEFSDSVNILENGYFSTAGWWENPATKSIIILENIIEPQPDARGILSYDYDLLSMTGNKTFWYGQNAYEEWSAALSRDQDFDSTTVMPILLERLFCQNDCETMLAEGGYWGSLFLKTVQDNLPEFKVPLQKASQIFLERAACAQEMTALRKETPAFEQQLEIFCQPDIRRKLASLINKCMELDKKAAHYLKQCL